MIALLLNHLWQSSLFVGGAGLMALALRRNGANTRFWLWFAASIKFLIPFAALTALSATVLMPVLPTLSAPSVARIEPLAKPFSVTTIVPLTIRLAAEPSPLPAPPVHALEPVRPAPPPRFVQPARSTSSAFHFDLGSALLALWAAGFLMLVFRWIVRWSRVRALLRDAVAMPVQAPVAVKFSASRLEPGLVGIFNPVILLPQGIEQQLSPVELKAVLAHELCHWRRRDNLLAAIHMLVEALFWFFPLVWWLGARLNAERERACDESVLADGNDPQIYAEGILKVCRAYLQSPLACVAGVSGAGLKKRIDAIMENRLVLRLNAARKFVLSAAAAVALALPLALGLLAVPVVQLQAKAAQILSPVKTAGINAALPTLPEAALTAPPAHPAPENPAVPQTQDAATTSADAAPPVAAPQSSPDAAPAPAAAPTPNDTPQPQLKDAPAAMVAGNDPPAAPQAAAQTSVAQALAARTCELPKIANTVALEQMPGSDLMVVPVAVNGSPQKFLLDIGLKRPTQVSPELMAKLSLSEALPGLTGFGSASLFDSGSAYGSTLASVPVYSSGTGPGATGVHDIVSVHSFGIGRGTAQRLQFVVTNAGEIARSASYAGFLTGSFFRQYDVELDFAGKQVNWLTPVSCTDPNQVVFWAHKDVAVIPVSLAPDGRLQLQATIRGHVINAELDTSSAHTVMRRDIAERYVGLKADTSDMAPVSGLEDGRHMQVYVHIFPQLTFADGGVTAENVPVLIQDFSMVPAIYRNSAVGWRGDQERIPDLTIGMDVLRQLHMYAVLGQGRVYVTSAQPPPDAAPVAAPAPAGQLAATQMAQPAAAKPTTDQLRLQQAAEARTVCTDKNQGPQSPAYAECVNSYLQSHYGWRVGQRPDGSLHVNVPTGGLPQYF